MGPLLFRVVFPLQNLKENPYKRKVESLQPTFGARRTFTMSEIHNQNEDFNSRRFNFNS